MGKRKFNKVTKSFGKKDFKIFRPEVKPESFIKNKHVALDKVRESNLIIREIASIMSEAIEEQEDESLFLAKENLMPIIEFAFNKIIFINLGTMLALS